MIRTWLEEAIDLAKDITDEEYQEVLKRADLTCEMCGNCCIIPHLPFVDKPLNTRCQFLTEDNKCSRHDKDKPQPCQDFPYMDKKDWVLEWRLAPPRVAIWFCGILRKFWLTLYEYMKEKQQ